MRFPLHCLILLFLAAVLRAQSDPDGSIDLALTATVAVPDQVLLGDAFEARVQVTNAATAEGPAHDVGLVVDAPAGVLVVDCSIGAELWRVTRDDGGLRVAFEGRSALAAGDAKTWTIRATLDPALTAGSELELGVVVYADDGPFERGSPPPGESSAAFGGVDFAFAGAGSTDGGGPAADDAPLDTPMVNQIFAPEFRASDTLRAVVFTMNHQALVAEGERPTGLQVHAFESRLRLSGNDVAPVNNAVFRVVIPKERVFLGFGSLPVGVTTMALANAPEAGEVTLIFQGVDIAVGATTDLLYQSAIPARRVTDSRSPLTSPAALETVAGGSSIQDGGATPGGGDASSAAATAVSAQFLGFDLGSDLMPLPESATVESDLFALQISTDLSQVEIGDSVTVTLQIQVSEYLQIEAPAVLEVRVPDGLSFVGASGFAASSLATAGFALDSASTTPESGTGDTRLRFVLDDDAVLAAGTSLSASVQVAVDGTFEGSGGSYFEARGHLDFSALVSGVVRGISETPADLDGVIVADDSSARVRAPGPALSTQIVKIISPGGAVTDSVAALAGNPYDPVASPLLPGAQIVFATTVTLPAVPVLGAELEARYPLATGAALQMPAIEVNQLANLLNLAGDAVAVHDADGDGQADGQWGGISAPFALDGSSFASGTPNNGIQFPLGVMPTSSQFAILATTTVEDAPPENLPSNGLVRERQVAIFSYQSEGGQVIETLSAEVEFDIAFPVLSLDRAIVNGAGVAVTDVDAGDVLTQRTLITSTGQTSAWVDVIRDSIPGELVADLSAAVLRDGAGTVVPVTAATVGNELHFSPATLSGSGRFEIPAGETWSLEYPATVALEIFPGENLVAEVALSWWTTATSAAGDAFGPIADTNSLTAEIVQIQHVLVSSSADFSSGTTLAMGEDVTLEARISIPEVSVPQARIVYTIPTGMEILSAQITTIDAPLATPTGPIVPVFSQFDAAGGDGLDDRIEVALGDLINPADDDLPEEIVMTVVARVRNAGGHDDGDLLRPRARFYSANQLLRSRNRTLVVRIPNLRVGVSFNPTILQGGDTATCTLRIEHAPGSGIAGLDLAMSHIAPAELNVLTVGASRDSGNLPQPATVTGSAVSADPLLIGIPHLPVGSWFEVDVIATVAGGLPFETEIEAEGDLLWSTLSGSVSAEANYQTQGSGVAEIRDPALTRLFENDNEAGTVGTELTVGEAFDVVLRVEVPAGFADDLVIEDELGEGWHFLQTLAVSVDAGLSVEFPNPAVEIIESKRRWSFGDVSRSLSGGDLNIPRFIDVRYRAQVLNLPSSQTGAAIVAAARVIWEGGASDPVGGFHPLILPRIVATGSCPRVASGPGLPVIYRVNFRKVGAAQFTSEPIAYDAQFRMVLPTNAQFAPGVTTPEILPFVDLSSEPGVLHLSFGDISDAEEREILFGFTLDSSFGGEVVSFPGEFRWSSRPGIQVPIDANEIASGERSGSSTDPGGEVNDLLNLVEASFDDLSTFVIGFEDLAFSPSANDFDYNDVVLRVQNQPTVSAGYITQLEADVDLVARGAAFDHEVRLRLGIAGPVSVSIERRDASGLLLSQESFSSDAAFIPDLSLFAATQNALQAYPGVYGFAANTSPDQLGTQALIGHSAKVVVTVLDPSQNPFVPDDPATPQIQEDIEALYGFSLEVLSNGSTVIASGAGRTATQALVSASAFPSSPVVGLPMAQARIFGRNSKWPTETTPLWEAYPDFVALALGQPLSVNWNAAPAPVLTWPLGAESDDLGSGGPQQSAFTVSSNDDRVLGTPVHADLNADGRAEFLTVSRELRLMGRDLATGQSVIDRMLGDPGESTLASPRLWDRDADGRSEVVIGTEQGRLLVFDPVTGQVDCIWQSSHPIKSTPAVGDVNGDGNDDLVVVGGDGQLYAFGPTLIPGFPQRISRRRDEGNHVYRVSSPILVDLDGRGGLEIVVATLDGRVLGFDSRGHGVFSWSGPSDAVFTATPTVTDLDADGRIEIIVFDDAGRLQVLNSAGRPRWTEAYQLDFGAGLSSPLAADLDGDGLPEIVIAGRQGHLVALDSEGKTCSGFPVALGREVFAAPIAADLDGRPGAEIIVSTYSGRIAICDAQGRLQDPRLDRTTELSAPGPLVSEPLIIDGDRDGFLDLVVAGAEGPVTLGSFAAALGPVWSEFRGGPAATGGR